MVLEVGAFEAKTNLSKLLDLTKKGKRITITKHGVPVAQLIPPDQKAGVNVDEVVKELKAIQKRTKKSQESIRDLLAEGRRF
jgi:prevent-host-death family protein